MKRVYLVRHGETEGNLGKYFQDSDTALSSDGHKGAELVADRFKGIEVDTLISSSFNRAHQTAGYISDVLDIPVTTDESFFELLRPVEIRGLKHFSKEGIKHRESYKTDFYDKDWKPEGAENYYDVIERVQKSLTMLENSHGENIVVVSHGDYIRSIVSFLLLGKIDNTDIYQSVFNTLERMSNVGITEITLDDEGWKLFLYNDHAHFAE